MLKIALAYYSVGGQDAFIDWYESLDVGRRTQLDSELDEFRAIVIRSLAPLWEMAVRYGKGVVDVWLSLPEETRRLLEEEPSGGRT